MILKSWLNYLKEFGIPRDSWKNKELLRIDINDTKKLNLRMSTGNEGGVNDLSIQ